MKWLAWLGCACVALSTAIACSGEEDKKVQPGQAGGAGGEVTAPVVAGSQSSGGDGGVGGSQPVDGGAAGAAPVAQGGQAGSAEGGAGGEGGAPVAELSIATLQGTWTGQEISSYVCEDSVEPFELSIEGSTITTTWSFSPTPGVGQLEQQVKGGQAFTFSLFLDEETYEVQDYRGQLFVHPTGEYALYVVIGYTDEGLQDSISVALLQKADAAQTEFAPTDLLGGWQGTGFELDDDFAVTEQFASGASFDDPDGYVVDGEDRDGPFSGVVYEEGPGSWSASVSQDPNELGLLTLMSDDKRVLGVALLRVLSENNGALCNLDAPYVDMSVHKFALWTRTPE